MSTDVSTSATSRAVEVQREAIAETRQVTDELGPLADGAVRLKVDRVSLTANTITYAEFGHMLAYWDFYPTGDDTFGRVPAMGWAEVAASNHPDVPVGGRYYGWYPMAQYVDVTVTPTPTGLRDDGDHRAPHAPVYRTFEAADRDPLLPTGITDADRGDVEDRHALVRGLFATGFLADAFFGAHDYYGAEQTIVLSASSKTAIGFADCAAARNRGALIGVTSPANVEFVRNLDLYTDVITYDQVGDLAIAPSVTIDMAGNGTVLGAIHDRLGDQLKYSMVVGRTHHDSPPAEVQSGPTPEMFFAPTAISLLAESGVPADEVQASMAKSLARFVEGSQEWLTVERHRGADATESAWKAVYAGDVPPNTGVMVSLHD